ncbi:MAG: N-acetyltransferase [Pirellulaceae bacterium]|nr:N-acetyltransferase [Pirellulaceae bacterium]
MSSVEIHTVHGPRLQRQFFELPWDLYREDPQWIPPLRRNQQELLGFKPHPFYDQAEIRNFLAVRQGRAVGRVSAIVNHAHNRRYAERRGFFGFFESIDDVQVSRALLDRATDWLRDRGMHSVRGPMNPSMNYECGLLTDGFDSPPFFMMTYNHPYYVRLLEDYGFQKAQDLFAFWGHIEMLQSLDKKLEFVVTEATRRFGLKLRGLDRRRFDQEVRTFLDIYNRSLEGTWGFVPMSDAEMGHMSAALKWLIVPELTSVVEVEGRPVGACFALLDYNPRIRDIDGRLFPLGFWKLLRNKQQITRIRLISTNVLPEYQRWGLGLVVLARLVPIALEWGIQEAEFSWVLESNHLSFKSLQRGGAKLSKSYRIYDYDFQS